MKKFLKKETIIYSPRKSMLHIGITYKGVTQRCCYEMLVLVYK
ncbi:MAG: hypothetical protein WKI04_15025 [Ferruginibacter sp.]